jgi:hypothetical protein
VMPPVISPVAKYPRSEPNSLSTSFEGDYRAATSGQTMSMITSADLPTDQSLPVSLAVSGPARSNSVMAGYLSAYAQDDAALRLISARNATKSRPFPI